ncbi:MAG: TonB-dependent receptor [Deferribacteres bacterium]|nr:TonB-dependent receptor [candidate division KSB1 bacterium]MCB9503882.1 TonB-dependent receptor [Deferribacteres bacterium]
MKKLMIVVSLLLVPGFVFAQGNVSGTVTDAQSGDGLPGANIVVVGTTYGAAADANGDYEIENVPVGSYELRVSFIGYEIATQNISVSAGGTATADFALEQIALISEGVMISASRARERETPVAFTDVKKEMIEANLGSRDIPLALDVTPSVYATMQGGGAGDARINVRGFNQRNVAIMINGVPVNDMENGWVYWSNWDGVGDAAESIQIQRGLSAINLATPSIGGTMNIITDPTALEQSGSFKQEFGSGAFIKSTGQFASGQINDNYAFNGTLVRKFGDGVIDKTWTDAWAYYAGATYNINDNNRLELYAVGAPQLHGQNLYKQNIGIYSASFAKDLGADEYDPAALLIYPEQGREYNQTWGAVSSSYKGMQWWNEGEHQRYDPSFINERENFFHKPQVNLNWFSKINDQMGLYSIFYYSGGHGGGTGTYGSIRWDYSKGPNGVSRQADWDATIARNKTSSDASAFGALRNSRNNQWTLGAISKLNYKLNESTQLIAGIDWRTAEIEHYYELRDLLGAGYYVDYNNEFDVTDADRRKGLGDKVNYFNTNTVDWLGGFLQAEYTQNLFTIYGTAGYSAVKYSYTDHFTNVGGKELYTEADWIKAAQVKGGAMYRATEDVEVYGNFGFVEKTPIFDNVISDFDGTKSDNPANEKFQSYEAGVNLHALSNQLTLKTSLYYTSWKDRANTRQVTLLDGTENLIFLSGMNQLHQGVEVEAAYQPIKMFRLDAVASVGNWKYMDDVNGRYKEFTATGQIETPYTYYVKDLRVGDQPQTQIAIAASVTPMKGLNARVVMKNYMENYADWDPFSRTSETDRAESWKAPNYNVFDFHAYYRLPMKFSGVGVQLFAHAFNILDTEYIQDAVDNSSFNAYTDNGKTHSADDAEVYFGIPRTYNVGLRLNF